MQVKLDSQEFNIPGEDEVQLWYVRGLAGYWPTKIAAEIVARYYFPDDGPDERYARVYYRRFISD